MVISSVVFKVPAYTSYNKVLRLALRGLEPAETKADAVDPGFHSLNLDMSDLKLGPL